MVVVRTGKFNNEAKDDKRTVPSSVLAENA